MSNAVFIQCSFSFDVSSANRKKAEARKTGGGPAPPPLTNAEEMALSLNTGRPVAEGIPAGCSSEPVTPQDTSAYIKCKRATHTYIHTHIYKIYLFTFIFGLVSIDSDGNICLLEPPVLTEPQAVVSVLISGVLSRLSNIIKCAQPNAHLLRM